MRLSKAFGIADFNDILLSSPQPVLVGGQAVNLWAQIMLPYIPELEELQPFVSKDCDVYGSADFLLKHANTKPWKVTFSRKGHASPVVGYLSAKNAAGQELLIEVLYAVKGLSDEDLAKTSKIELDGKTYRVLNPIMLLKAKLANYCELPQNTPGQERQDLKHIRILIPCVSRFLYEFYTQIDKLIQNAPLNEAQLVRNFVNLLEETLQVVQCKQGQQFSQEQGLNLMKCFPPSLNNCPHTKIQNFVIHRLKPSL